LNLCSSLYASPGSVAAPYYTYQHGHCVVSYPGCHAGGASITGIAFYQGGSYPAAYNGALFFADHSRNEIWAMMPGADGLHTLAQIRKLPAEIAQRLAARLKGVAVGPAAAGSTPSTRIRGPAFLPLFMTLIETQSKANSAAVPPFFRLVRAKATAKQSGH